MSDPQYRLDDAGDGLLRVWHVAEGSYIMEIPPPRSFVVAMTYEVMQRHDQQRADTFLYGYHVGFAHAVMGRTECREIPAPDKKGMH